MRSAFIDALTKAAGKDKRIFLLTGDLGFSVLEEFQQRYPGRFINAGVAEANMIGVAAGLALTGKIVYVYSIVPFVTLRCLEQIRNDVCYQKLNVRIVGVGGGLSYGTAGGTHYSLEDIAIMRALPDLTVICPGDPFEAEAAALNSIKHNGPIYIRLGKGRDQQVHKKLRSFKIGKGILLKSGKDLAIIATGNMLPNAFKAATLLEKKGLGASVISMHTIKPIDREMVLGLAKAKKAIFTIEEHYVSGGLGSAVAEILAELSEKPQFKRIALRSMINVSGRQDFLREKTGLHPEGIARTIVNHLIGK